ncbi:MAG: GTPase [Clostridium sp.]|jgi:uncharacterized repeat protein (TIGR03943 family)|nr:GTPase [Clostridium sp.]
MKPVYVINGFLESGKTEFITFTLSQPYFRISGRTLILLCEEGESEYGANLLRESRSLVETIESEEAFTPSRLQELERKHKPERIVIEYNGMWNFRNMKLPKHWKIEQQITILDGSKFQPYYTNLRALLSEMIRDSDMVVFNRCDEVKDLNTYKRNVKAVNPSAEVIFEDSNGEINQILEDDLPYDINQELLELDSQAFGIWYLDSMEHIGRYEGKQISFTGIVLKPDRFPKDYFVPGRMAMTCCADDMVFFGYACRYDGAYGLKEKDWVKVTAAVKKEYFAGYQGEGPVLYAVAVEKAKAPAEQVIRFA